MNPDAQGPAADEQALRDALADFETCLETPLVPGEFERWLAGAREALDRVDGLLRKHIEGNHKGQIRRIAAEDNEMFAHVESLKQADAQTIENLDWLKEWGARLAGRTEKTEPDEGKLEGEFAEFIKKGLVFIIHVRRQEVALTTWLIEAFNRERGAGD